MLLQVMQAARLKGQKSPEKEAWQTEVMTISLESGIAVFSETLEPVSREGSDIRLGHHLGHPAAKKANM